MIPIQLAGLVLAGRALQTKYGNTTTNKNNKNTCNNRAPLFMNTLKFPNNIGNPLEVLTRTISASMEQLKKVSFGEKNANENYYAILKRFIPEEAQILTPQYPSYAREIHLTDIEEDSVMGLIASYKQDNEIRTIILKKQYEGWEKVLEIKNSGFDNLNYRDLVDITGTGQRHLLIGLSTKGKAKKAYGYSLKTGNAVEQFTYDYDRLDVFVKPEPSPSNYKSSKADLAIWTKRDDETYGINFLRWNGQAMELVNSSRNNNNNYNENENENENGDDIRVDNFCDNEVDDRNSSEDDSYKASYYRRKVIPHFVKRVRQAPYKVSNWYGLAEALIESHEYNDALIAINTGMEIDRDSSFKIKFRELKSRVAKK